MTFEWDDEKDRTNQEKHGLSFEEAQYAFADPERLIIRDEKHSTAEEERFFCLGKVDSLVMTVRFTMRGRTIRIFGAANWRKGARLYENRKRT